MRPTLPVLQTLASIDVPRRLSKKRHIYDSLLSQIQDHSLPVGTRLPSAAALAEEWQVAYATVHAALNELTREGWLVRYPKQGTFVSTPPRNGREQLARTAMIVMPPQADIVSVGNGDEVFEVMQGVAAGARSVQWQVQIETIPSFPTDTDKQLALEHLRSAAAVIFIDGSQYRDLRDQLAAEGVLTMSVMAMKNPGVGGAITYDRPLAMKLAVEYLVQSGRRKIGYLGNTREKHADGKYNAFRKLLDEHGLELEERWICHCASHRSAGEVIEAFVQTQPDCDAVVAANYQFATALAHKALRHGVAIPEELAIVANGIRGNRMDEFPLTYVRTPYLEFGIEAMKWIAAQPQDAVETQYLILPPELVPGESA